MGMLLCERLNGYRNEINAPVTVLQAADCEGGGINKIIKV